MTQYFSSASDRRFRPVLVLLGLRGTRDSATLAYDGAFLATSGLLRF